jgi:glucose-6-phosphate isomerase
MDCTNIHETTAWTRLQEHANHIKSHTHLRELLKDSTRNECLVAEHDGIMLDFSRECVTKDTMGLLFDLATVSNMEEKRVSE